MADQFIGATVLATIRDPPNAKVRGLVTDVIGQQLTLSNVTWLSTGLVSDTLAFKSSDIVELDIVVSRPKDHSTHSIWSGTAGTHQSAIDPAIVSYGRNAKAPRANVNGKRPALDPAIVSIGRVGQSSSARDNVHTNGNSNGNTSAIAKTRAAGPETPVTTAEQGPAEVNECTAISVDTVPSATLSGPSNGLSLNGHADEPAGGLTSEVKSADAHIAHTHEKSTLNTPLNKTRLDLRKPLSWEKFQRDLKATSNFRHTEAAAGHLRSPSQEKKSNGWRQTPFVDHRAGYLLEISSALADFVGKDGDLPDDSFPAMETLRKIDSTANDSPSSAFPKVRKRNRRRRQPRSTHDFQDQNGWATGEATDIQDMGDFDFEENLSKFDKLKVFQQLKEQDTTADEARLVSHNRVHPGTNGGKNLHFTENVLDSPQAVEQSSGTTDHDIGKAKTSSGVSSHHHVSPNSLRKAPSKKIGAPVADDVDPAKLNVPTSIQPRCKSSSHIVASCSMTGSVSLADVKEGRPNLSDIPNIEGRTRKLSQQQLPKPFFRIASTDCTCRCISPVQMLELEQLASSDFGLSEDMMTENAARSIAGLSIGLAHIESEPWDHLPLVVVLAGNNKTGSRAIAAARHLRNHGAQVVLCVLGLEHEQNLLENIRRQLNIYRRTSGNAIQQDQLMKTLRQLHAPTNLIVDAMLGMHLSFEDLTVEDQAAYFQLVCWANGGDAPILAIDVPSGIDASTGQATIHDDNELFFRPHYVLSLGAPKIGLLTAVEHNDVVREVGLFIGDIGISNLIWRKFSNRRHKGIQFGRDWVADLQYQAG